MRKGFKVFTALCVAILPMVVHATDPVPQLGPDGHYYVVIPAASGTTWHQAKAAAENAELLPEWGIAGHLATITSEEERDFVETLRLASGLGQVWIGGFQTENSGSPGTGWNWVNDEGPITTFYWAPGEPNDGGSGENNAENHLATGRYGNALWNDEGVALNLIQGFVVEFSGTVDASNCVAGSGTVCNPSGVQSVELPADINLPDGATITQLLVRPKLTDGAAVCPGSQFAFLDPRVHPLTGRVIAAIPLDVFNDGELILPAHQFGSPCFALVQGGANFDLTPALSNGGVVNATQIPGDVPGIGQTFACLSSTNPDLQTTTQFGYQTDNRFDMVEEAAVAVTNGCNSPSRAGTFKFSYFVLNTHEDCGIDYAAPGGRAAVQQCFTNRAVDYFNALEVVLNASAPNLIKPKFSTLSSKFNQARSMTKTGQYAKSNQRLQDLLSLVESGQWDVSNGKNEPGNLIMRINNLIFRNEQLLEAASY